MVANNETGTIQPVRELVRIAHDHGALFHTDATQAIGKMPVDAVDLDVDFLNPPGTRYTARRASERST
jgi:cysteine desulfurase